MYMIVFCLADLLAIVVQAVGGAMAALALQSSNDSTPGTVRIKRWSSLLDELTFSQTTFPTLPLSDVLLLPISPRFQHIMVAGIVIQLVSMFVFIGLGLDFFLRARESSIYSTSHRNGIRRLLIGLSIGSAFILVRCIYRTIELAQGWTGWVISLFVALFKN